MPATLDLQVLESKFVNSQLFRSSSIDIVFHGYLLPYLPNGVLSVLLSDTSVHCRSWSCNRFSSLVFDPAAYLAAIRRQDWAVQFP